ncbi:MAG: hypothetical protein A2Z62_01495 [Candidatus Terrybacteria bacterium RIFCSPLOWO2_02_42_20]|uniref:Uncharacterized protein n=1 Tax=Candidatus Terrybacteria bacterium RIFCSPLOWO2_02_42_20 TaxID=1802370 RepID=A0A1G2PZM6_9BACT|nr:MAG: hypothetical protein A2Z62_01495 [Candidatus Terrybacteria bacterium RIFCSPLOWO2_02_42_20]
MKTNFSKKAIKILTVIFLTFFLLFVYVRAQEDNNPYTNPGESTTGFEQPSANNNNGENNNGTNDSFEIDNPADYQTMKAMKGGSDTSGDKFTYTLLQSLPKEGTDLSENVTLEEYLTWAFRFVLALAGFLAVMMIVIGGVEYIISGASESMREEAKKRIENAIWGLVMALVSYLVLYTINPSLVNFEDNCFFKDCDKKTTSTGDGTFEGGGGGEFGGGGTTGDW